MAERSKGPDSAQPLAPSSVGPLIPQSSVNQIVPPDFDTIRTNTRPERVGPAPALTCLPDGPPACSIPGPAMDRSRTANCGCIGPGREDVSLKPDCSNHLEGIAFLPVGLPHGWLVQMPRGLPALPSVALLSSRLPDPCTFANDWYQALRTAVIHARHDGQALLLGKGMTASQSVEELAGRLGIQRIVVTVAESRPGKRLRPRAESVHPLHWPVMLIRVDDAAPDISLDELLASLARQVRVLHVRIGSHTERVVRQRLGTESARGSTWVLGGLEGRGADSAAGGLIEDGAVPWLLDHPRHPRERGLAFCDSTEASTPTHPPPPDDWLASEGWLFHWTRAPSRLTRKQQDWELRLWLAGLPEEIDERLVPLISIVGGGMLCASNRLNRESDPVVSWTAVPLPEFRSRRVFRPHLHRYDFELAGIGVRKEALRKLGARPVVYGDDDDWERLSPADRPWFHPRGKPDLSSEGGRSTGCWEAEREWRFPGNLNLFQFGPADLVVFVPDEQSVCLVEQFSRWPVVVVPEPAEYSPFRLPPTTLL